MSNMKTCSFCGNVYDIHELDRDKVLIFAGERKNNVRESFICSTCAQEFVDIYNKYIKDNTVVNVTDIDYIPETIKKHLDSWVIGQEKAKITVATEVYNHLKRIKRLEKDPEANKKLRIDKTNIILIGKSGSGKTELVRALGEILDLPYTIQNSTSLTASGYVGRDVEDILKDLLDAANNDISQAEKGIVFIDEFDKLKKEYTASGNKDVGGEAVQQALLKMIEGGEFEIRRDKQDKSSAFKIDTTNILFILGGAFEGIENITSKRIKKSSSIGFGSHIESKKKVEYNDIAQKITQEDLKEFGIIAEILGRCPIIAPFNELTEEELMTILTKPKHAIIKQFKELMSLDREGLELEFTEESLKAIAKLAKKKNIGARALRTIVTDTLSDAMYLTPKDKTIKKIIVNKDLQCEYIRDEIY